MGRIPHDEHVGVGEGEGDGGERGRVERDGAAVLESDVARDRAERDLCETVAVEVEPARERPPEPVAGDRRVDGVRGCDRTAAPDRGRVRERVRTAGDGPRDEVGAPLFAAGRVVPRRADEEVADAVARHVARARNGDAGVVERRLARVQRVGVVECRGSLERDRYDVDAARVVPCADGADDERGLAGSVDVADRRQRAAGEQIRIAHPARIHCQVVPCGAGHEAGERPELTRDPEITRPVAVRIVHDLHRVADSVRVRTGDPDARIVGAGGGVLGNAGGRVGGRVGPGVQFTRNVSVAGQQHRERERHGSSISAALMLVTLGRAPNRAR